MNAIGQIGNLIMIYQEPLQVAAIAILVILGMICFGKMLMNASKKRKTLSQIHETVLEIDANVKSLQEKRTEIIYIDGRMSTETAAVPVPDKQEAEQETVRESVEHTPEKRSEEEEQSESEQNPTVKYFSRDCATAKDGRQYTVEELNAQIRD